MTRNIATCMYYTGLDPFIGQEVYVGAICAIASCNGRFFSSSSRRITSRSARPYKQWAGTT